MGKVLGIVAEYNPFHNGHLYHLEKSKAETKCTYTISVIGGNFTQRGNTSLVDKWCKAQMALENGIDLVIELPVLYCISSAENFAEGSIKILNSLNVVDYISFGAETSNLDILNKFASVLYEEPEEYKSLLTHELSKGISYPKARENALMLYLNDVGRFENIVSSPNNILAIEYLKCLKKYNSNITPISITRYKSDYNSINSSNNIASATAIRNIIKNNDFDTLRNLVPESSYSILMDNIKTGHVLPDLSVFEKIIIYKLRKMSIQEIANLPDVNEGLEYAIKNTANSCNSIIEFLNIIKTKRYTNTRIQRILLYTLLGITKKDILMSKQNIPYLRVLGFNEHGKHIISQISKLNPQLPIIVSAKKFQETNTNKNLSLMLDFDINATNIYTVGYDYDSCSNLDFTHKPIII